MRPQESHLSDQELLLAADGELSAVRAMQVATHLSECWTCRARKQEIGGAIVDFVRLHHDSLNPQLPPVAGPRALLKAQLAEMASVPQPWASRWLPIFTWSRVATALFFAAAIGAGYYELKLTSRLPVSARTVPVSFPEPSLTPGAVVTVSREQICQSAQPKNRAVSASLQRRVFAEYGIPTAQPQAYEVDYLITPALGGAEDIRNLWPQSYSPAVWNAHVKDALEDRLRDLVCEGTLDPAAAQHEISSDWIAAYKKYFHTDKPLETVPSLDLRNQ